MANALMVTEKGRKSTWAVHEVEDTSRSEWEVVRPLGPLAGSVSSWADLYGLADKYGVEPHQIYGDGLEEMERELGPTPQ